MNARIMRDMDTLEHSKEHGFYDRDLDMYFRDLSDWLREKHGTTFSKIL